MPPPLLDCHLHYAPDWKLEEWHEAGVTGGIVASVTRDDWQTVLNCCGERRDLLLPALGIHPWQAAQADAEALNELNALLDANPRALLGEIGLDYVYGDAAPHSVQEDAFLAQAEMAIRLKRPAVLHLRGNWERVLTILNQCRELTGIVHCFSGSADVAGRIIRNTRLNISFGPALLRPNARRIRESAAAVPLDRIFTDSDYPWQKADPTICADIVTSIAAAKNIPPEECAAALHDNWKRLLGCMT